MDWYANKCSTDYQTCNRVRTSFNAPIAILQSLSIMDLGYWWSLDFTRLLPSTKRNNKYVSVMIEHFSKSIELVALLDKLVKKQPMFSLTEFLANLKYQRRC